MVCTNCTAHAVSFKKVALVKHLTCPRCRRGKYARSNKVQKLWPSNLRSWADIFEPEVLKDIGEEGWKHTFLRTTTTDLDLWYVKYQKIVKLDCRNSFFFYNSEIHFSTMSEIDIGLDPVFPKSMRVFFWSLSRSQCHWLCHLKGLLLVTIKVTMPLTLSFERA